MQRKRANIISFIIICTFLFLLRRVQGAGDSLSLGGLGETTKIEYKSENLRDPFEAEKIRPPEKKREPTPAEVQIPVEIKPLPPLNVQGIIWGSALPQAIINNEVLKIGDTIEGAQITDISKSKVSVIFFNKEYNLSVSSPTNPNGPGRNPQGGEYER